jgi:putative DNA primase/helicase
LNAQVGHQLPRLNLDRRDPMGSARALKSECFTDGSGRRLLHRYRGAYWHYRNGCYREVEAEVIRSETWTFLDGATLMEGDSFRPTISRVADVVQALESLCQLSNLLEAPAWLAGAADLHPPSEYFALGNGLLHLPTGELHPPTPDFFTLSASEVVFDERAPPPTNWWAFLEQIFGDDVAAKVALQDWFGYVLAPDTSQQKILLIVGPPRSGKGTIGRLLTSLLGRDNVVGPTLTSLANTFGLQPLIGRPLAIISDARIGARADQAAIAERLLSISGEDVQTIDRKHRQSWTGRVPTRFMVLTNELPRIADSSSALAKRYLVLTLQTSFLGIEDHGLDSRLQAELPGILNWALEGYSRLRRRGHFVQPDSARDAIGDLEALSSPMSAFIADCCIVGGGCGVLISDLYSAWKEWCTANGRDRPGSLQSFCRDLRSASPALRRTQPRGLDGRPGVYQGIKLR